MRPRELAVPPVVALTLTSPARQVVGDVADMCLNYFCVVRIAKRADIPPRLLQQMLANNAVSASFSCAPPLASFLKVPAGAR